MTYNQIMSQSKDNKSKRDIRFFTAEETTQMRTEMWTQFAPATEMPVLQRPQQVTIVNEDERSG